MGRQWNTRNLAGFIREESAMWACVESLYILKPVQLHRGGRDKQNKPDDDQK